MQTKIILWSMIYSIQLCVSAPELVGSKSVEVPFVSKELKGTSEYKSGYAFAVEYTNANCVFKVVNSTAVVDRMTFPKNVSIHGLTRTAHGAWFLVRVWSDFAGKAGAVGFCDLRRDDGPITLYKVAVKGDGPGSIFDLVTGSDEQLEAVCCFRDSHSTRKKFYKGMLNRANLEVISIEDFTHLHAKRDVEPGQPLTRVPAP